MAAEALLVEDLPLLPPPPLVLVPLSPPLPPLELSGALARFILNLTARPFRYSMMGWSRPLLLLLMLLPPTLSRFLAVQRTDNSADKNVSFSI